MSKKLALAIFGASLAFTISSEVHAACGKIEVSKGDVKIQSNGKTSPAPAGTKICSGDTIITSAESRAKLKMEDGNELNVSPDSKIVLENYEYKPADNKKKVLLNVLQGKIRAATKQENMYNDKSKDGQANTFQVRTKSAVAGVRGTDFLTGFDARSNKTEVVTFKGKVDVGQPGPSGQILNAVSVPAGQKTEALPGQPPAPPSVVPKAEFDQANSETKAETAGSDKQGSTSAGGEQGKKEEKGEGDKKDSAGNDKKQDSGDKDKKDTAKDDKKSAGGGDDKKQEGGKDDKKAAANEEKKQEPAKEEKRNSGNEEKKQEVAKDDKKSVAGDKKADAPPQEDKKAPANEDKKSNAGPTENNKQPQPGGDDKKAGNSSGGSNAQAGSANNTGGTRAPAANEGAPVPAPGPAQGSPGSTMAGPAPGSPAGPAPMPAPTGGMMGPTLAPAPLPSTVSPVMLPPLPPSLPVVNLPTVPDCTFCNTAIQNGTSQVNIQIQVQQ